MPSPPNEFLFQHLESRNPALVCLRDPNIGLPTLNALAESLACPVRFCETQAQGALDYERHIVHEGQVPTRIHTWHDRFNAGMWLLWPHTKRSISSAHLQASQVKPEPSSRNRRRDALTLLDEAGVVIVAPKSIQQLHQAHAWEDLFWRSRSAWFKTVHPFFIGHGLAEQCLTPYIGLTGKALYLDPPKAGDPSVDLRLAALLQDPTRLTTPRQLCPFPLLGTPGWHPENEALEFYRNQNYFRPRSRRLSSQS